MEKKNVIHMEVYRQRRDEKKTESDIYAQSARNCLAYARYFSSGIKDNPFVLPLVKSYIRSMFCCLSKSKATLADIGTSEEELFNLISPKELRLSKEEKEKRWQWIFDR